MAHGHMESWILPVSMETWKGPDLIVSNKVKLEKIGKPFLSGKDHFLGMNLGLENFSLSFSILARKYFWDLENFQDLEYFWVFAFFLDLG